MTRRSLIGATGCASLFLLGGAGFWRFGRGQHYAMYADGHAVGTISIGRDLKIHLPVLDGLRTVKKITLVVNDSAIWGTVRDIVQSLLAAWIRPDSFVIETGAAPQAEIVIPGPEALAASMPGTWFVDDIELFRRITDPVLPEYSTESEVVDVIRVEEDGNLYGGFSNTPFGAQEMKDDSRRRGCVVYVPHNAAIRIVNDAYKKLKDQGYDAVVIASGNLAGPWPPFWVPRSMKEYPESTEHFDQAERHERPNKARHDNPY